MDYIVDLQSIITRLREDLQSSIDIAQGPDSVRPTTRYDIGSVSLRSQFLCHIIHGSIWLLFCESDISVQQPVQKQIALRRGWFSAKDQNRLESHLYCGCSGQSCVIGVLSACCDNRVSPLVLRITQQKLQFPHLIASESETHNIYSFNENSQTKPSTHRPRMLYRSGKGGMTHPWS